MHSMGNIGYMRTISRGRMRGTDFVGGVRTINCVTPIATNVVKLLDVSPFTRRRDEQVAKKKTRHRKFGIVLVVNSLHRG